MLNSDSISNIRLTVFALTGGVCLLYAGMVLATGRPDPMPFWIPGACGGLAAVILMVSSGIAGRKNAQMAWDEGYTTEARRAAGIAFWVALLLYPVFAILLAAGALTLQLAFPVMGLLTGASYLLLLTWFDLKGRA